MAVLGSAFSHVIVWTPLPLPPFIRGEWNSCNGGDGKFLLEMGEARNGAGGFIIGGMGNFYEDHPILPTPAPISNFVEPPPYFSVTSNSHSSCPVSLAE